MNYLPYQDYFNYIIKKYKAVTDNPTIRTYLIKINNRITFEIKKEYYLELLTPKTMKLLGSTKDKITKNKNWENVPHLKITEVALVYCNTFNNDYQKDLRVLHMFVPTKSISQLLDISPKNLISVKTSNSEFSYVETWFTDQNFKLLEIEDKKNITLVIN